MTVTDKLYPLDQYEKFFGTFSAHAIEVDGTLYPTVEHSYHVSRYADNGVREEIRTAKSPYLAWEISQKYKSSQLPDFDTKKVEVMEELCRAKLQQHADVKAALTTSGDDVIVKNFPDSFWGIGKNGIGKNVMGVMEFQGMRRTHWVLGAGMRGT